MPRPTMTRIQVLQILVMGVIVWLGIKVLVYLLVWAVAWGRP